MARVVVVPPGIVPKVERDQHGAYEVITGDGQAGFLPFVVRAAEALAARRGASFRASVEQCIVLWNDSVGPTGVRAAADAMRRTLRNGSIQLEVVPESTVLPAGSSLVPCVTGVVELAEYGVRVVSKDFRSASVTADRVANILSRVEAVARRVSQIGVSLAIREYVESGGVAEMRGANAREVGLHEVRVENIYSDRLFFVPQQTGSICLAGCCKMPDKAAQQRAIDRAVARFRRARARGVL